MRIWKFALAVADEQTVMMPVGAKLLDVQMQGDACCLWALCDENAAKEPRLFAIYGTGNPMPDHPGAYVATFQTGPLVFHVFAL
jgi:hypothetical protein